jgi:L-2-hydroxyglutarate oxidase LhgO
VATSEDQVTTLEKIAANARLSGVLDLEWLDGSEARRAEPQLHGVRALSSPSTGIIDSHSLMQSLLADAEAGGASIAYGTRVTAMRPTAAGVEIAVNQDPEPVARAKLVVNSAGLQSDQVAACIAGFPRQHIPKLRFAKGSYFSLSGASPFSRLVYPVPKAGGHLGIHMTLDLGGAARFGPDTEWVERIDYAVDPKRVTLFAEVIREYWPGLEAGRLYPAYAGIRPKISAEGDASRDFLISGPHSHGVPGVVNLFGMESPGLTASLALGDYIAGMAD